MVTNDPKNPIISR